MRNCGYARVGEMAQIPGYRIAGKGTAEKANIHGGGYYRGAKITSFIGIVPVESPAMWWRWWMSRKKGIIFGSTVAAPVLSRSWKRYWRFPQSTS